MKILNILILLFYIQFILAQDETTEEKDEIPKYCENIPKNDCLNKENPSSSDDCENLTKTNSENNCCFFSFVSGVKRIQKCYEIKKDYYEIHKFINSLESTRCIIDGVKKYDDVSIDCFVNFLKYNNYIILFLLLLL